MEDTNNKMKKIDDQELGLVVGGIDGFYDRSVIGDIERYNSNKCWYSMGMDIMNDCKDGAHKNE